MPTLHIKGIPEELYHVLSERAKCGNRSLSDEVIHLLELAMQSTAKKTKSILQLRGLGKNYWVGIDAAKHVEKERGSWA